MNGNLAYKSEPAEEIIGGEFVMMATPTLNHNRVTGNIYHLFRTYLKDRKCEPFPDGTALYLEEGAEEYKPDMMVVCDPDKLQYNGVHGTPDLVVEVLSPSTARYDRGHKNEIYEKYGVKEYWIVDPANRTVEQYILEESRFVLHGVFALYPDFMLQKMKEEEKAEMITEFQCSLFDDLPIRLEDIFYRVSPIV